jgi:hypothetical protein
MTMCSLVVLVHRGSLRAYRVNETPDPARVALLLGLSIGLGIAVHEGFFLVAGAIAVGALTVATARALQEHAEPCTTGSSTSLSI